MSKFYLKNQFEKRKEYEDRLEKGENLSASEIKEYKIIKLSTKGFERRNNNLIILIFIVLGGIAGDVLNGISPLISGIITIVFSAVLYKIYSSSKKDFLSQRFLNNNNFMFVPFFISFSQWSFFESPVDEDLAIVWNIYTIGIIVYILVMAYKTTKASNESFERLVKEDE